MEKIKRIFFCVILMLIFFGSGGHKAVAAVSMNNIDNWTWNTSNLCWNNLARKTVTFTIVGNTAEVSGFSVNGHTFMYLDAEAELNTVINNSECYKLEDPVPVSSKMIFHTYSAYLMGGETVFYPITDITLTPGTHTISCFGFADVVSGGNGGCEFGLKPSCNISAAPSNVQIGDPSTLSWTTSETLTARLDPPGTEIANASIASGNVIVVPPLAGINTYSMTVRGIVSNRTCQANINVEQPTCVFSVSPSYVIYGDKATLSWTTVGVTSAQIDNSSNVTSINPADLASGSMEVIPLLDTTYTMIADGKDGPVVCPDAKVTVSAPLPKNEGLVPCARISDNLATTDVNEAQACSICTLFLMLKNIINFIMELAIGTGVMVFVLIGLVYIFSGGSLNRISSMRSAINSVITGIIIIFMIWVAIAIILQAMGYAKVSVWRQVSCDFHSVPSPVINLKMTPGNDMNTLTWDPPLVNVAGLPILYYNVYCGTSPHPFTICNLGSPSGYHFSGTTFVNTGLENGKNYYYIVAAVNANGEGIWSNEVGTMFDCDASDPNIFQWRTVSTDKDRDRWGTTVAFIQCVGEERIINGAKYYKNSAGNYYFIDAASMLGSPDCNDNDKLIWQFLYRDSDHDGFCDSNAKYCIGSDKGYNSSCGSCLIGGVTDCNPYDNIRWCQRYYDHDGDGYGDANIDIFGGPVTLGLGPLFCVGNQLGFVDNNTDCDPDNFWIYQLKNVVHDKDQDGYSVKPPAVPSDPELINECVGDSLTVVNTRGLSRTYYRNSVGVFEFVDSGASWLNRIDPTDCDPNNVCIYQMKSVATDRDHDTFIADAVSMRCVGDKIGSWYKNDLCQDILIDETAIMQYGTAGSHSLAPDDCRDDIASVNKHGTEIPNCDNLDNDCDGTIDSFYWPCGWGCCASKYCSGGSWYGCCACPPPPSS